MARGVQAFESTGAIQAFLEWMRAPGREFAPHPFWFWNDDIEEDELLRQLRQFYEAGVGGVVIHPRIGLSRRVGYLTEEYFRLVRRVVDECARLGMKVVLYDECSYPSGSACGRVAAENPEFAARSLALAHRVIEGPAAGYWRPHLSRSLVDRIVSVCVARLVGEEGGVYRVDPATLRRLAPDERGVARFEVEGGRWLAMACIDTPSGGKIRGAHGEEDDGMALAPPAGDLMNPDAVAAFIRLTHEAYYEHLKDHFGTTVVAMFTDEPSPLGRGARRYAKPFTYGFESYFEERLAEEHPALFQAVGDVRAWLPALWLDFGPLSGAYREAYDRAVHRRVAEVFYKAQADWCSRRGIALTGHPSASNDMATLALFHWPGQDMVWRWVVPGNESGLVGEHSVAPKAATSAARAGGKRRVVSELLGAYGWTLTLDEVKWLVDWHLVRGNNLFMPHAYFYSVRGRRAFESEPDLFLHNAWRPYVKRLNEYIARVSAVLTDSEHVCDVAVLGEGRALPWRAARSLYEAQVDFLYIDDDVLAEAVVDESARTLRAGGRDYRAVVVDGKPRLSTRGQTVLDAFAACGGLVLRISDGDIDPAWVNRVRAASSAAVHPACSMPDLRVMRVRRQGLELFLLTNEGEGLIRGELVLPARGRGIWYDPLRDEAEEADLREEGEAAARVLLELERREARILAVDPAARARGARPAGAAVRVRSDSAYAAVGAERRAGVAPGTGAPGGREAPTPGIEGRQATTEPTGGPQPAIRVIDVASGWRVAHPGGAAFDVPAPGDWTDNPALERFSGTLCYHAEVSLKEEPRVVEIDLGDVGDIAEVYVNGEPAGIRLWAPYRIKTSGRLWRAGANRLEVRVTNSSANEYEGAMKPSGLLGPVRLIVEAAAPKARRRKRGAGSGAVSAAP